MAKKFRAKPGDPGVDARGQLVDVQKFVWHILGRQPGQYAGEQGVVDDSQDWFRQLKASGLPRGNADGVRPKENGFFGITMQVGAGGPRGAIFLPTDQPDALGFYAHEILLLDDAPGGKLVYAWRDRGAQSGQPPAVFVQPTPVDPGGQEPGNGGTEPGNGGEVEDQGEIVKLLETIRDTSMQQLREQEKTNKLLQQQTAQVANAAKVIAQALAGGGLFNNILKKAKKTSAKKTSARRKR